MFQKIFESLFKIIATFFYIGYIPVVPATIGTLFSIPIVIFFYSIKNTLYQIVALLFLIILSTKITTILEKKINRKDPKEIVIDEVIGFIISLFLIKINILNIILAFSVFRFLDILKPFPANKIQKINGGIGIMGDDIVVGIYTNILIRIIIKIIN